MTQQEQDVHVVELEASSSPLAPVWQRLQELWLAAVLTAFLILRVLASHTAQQLLERLRHAHLR